MKPILLAACTLLAAHAGADTLSFPTHDGKQEQARFSSPDPAAALRSYVHASTQRLRDPGPRQIAYAESAGLPTVRSGSLAFDALFALAGAEMRQDSVSQIRDGSYNGGKAIACDCFETGEQWHYVWTRDLSYAADLGLALLDPQRVRNSLEFKLSPLRAGVPRRVEGEQIVQDTGSGGSWPVSTDRVSWAFGAAQVLKTLAPAERARFARRALAALANTVENDRVAAFDKATGLYTGEQSFLDWREQSYAAWIVNDLAAMASAKALSTNVAHYQALRLAAQLAGERHDTARARRYQGWAEALKRAINERLWLEDEGMYSSLTAGQFDGAPLHKFDWLGQNLAIVTGVASPERARRILARYPHGPMGAPVIYPQQQDVPVYHNRAIWPFVTAYGLKAAAMSGNVAVADAAYATLIRGAALNLSNMENLEWLSGQPLLRDDAHPELSGPVISSRRQLWSVGAYLGMVIGSVFGVSATGDGVHIAPFITARMRRDSFGGASEIVLARLPLHGHRVTVKVFLPAASEGDGYYPVERISVNGAVSGADVRIHGDSTIEVRLAALRAGDSAIRRVGADPYAADPAVFGPREPGIGALARDGGLSIVAPASAVPLKFNVYRDGVLAATGVDAGVWTERAAAPFACYAVEAYDPASGNRSHHSAPRCLDEGQVVAALLKDWGKPRDRWEQAVSVAEPGQYRIQLNYRNTANRINLGISGGVKRLAVKDARGRVLADRVVQLPHAQGPAYSTPLPVRLAAGRYTLQLSDFYNMSYLRSNSSFADAGGSAGPSNRFDLLGVRLLRTH